MVPILFWCTISPLNSIYPPSVAYNAPFVPVTIVAAAASFEFAFGAFFEVNITFEFLPLAYAPKP